MNNFNKENTLAVTGLRRHKLDWDKKCYSENEEIMIALFMKTLERFISEDYTDFLCGMANGSDIIFAKSVIKLKDKYPDIRLHAVIPFVKQNKYYDNEDKIDYDDLMKKCDTIRIISINYSKDCYKNRNEFLIENSSVLLAVTYDINMIRSGTTQTINMARKQGLKIVQLDPHKFKVNNIMED